MPENTNLSAASPTTPTEVVDIAFPSVVACVGGALVVLGFFVRCGARWLASATVERFVVVSHDDASFYRSLYIDLGLMALAFGLALFCVALLRRERVVPMIVRTKDGSQQTKP